MLYEMQLVCLIATEFQVFFLTKKDNIGGVPGRQQHSVPMPTV